MINLNIVGGLDIQTSEAILHDALRGLFNVWL